MYSTGSTTRNTFRYGPEVHKLHLEFAPATGVTIHKGQPVMLNALGQVTPAVKGSLEYTIIGVSIHEGSSAYGDLVVIAMRGYAVVEGESGDGVTPTTADLVAGPCGYAGWVAAADTTRPTEPIQDGISEVQTTRTTGANSFNVAEDATDCIGWCLTPGGGAAGATPIAEGTPVLVVIKD